MEQFYTHCLSEVNEATLCWYNEVTSVAALFKQHLLVSH